MVSRTDVCYDLLKGRILDGTYGPGHRLVLDQLVRETDISTIPWRESMRRLEAEGWVEIVPNVGARVASFDAGEWARSMRLLARLEGLATALAATALSGEEVAQARRTNTEMKAALADFDPLGFSRLNRRFHLEVCRRADDAHLVAMLETEWARLELTRRSAFTHAPGRAVRSVEEHDALLDLLQAGADPDEIERAARQHKLNTLDAVLRHEAAVDPPVVRPLGSPTVVAEAPPQRP